MNALKMWGHKHSKWLCFCLCSPSTVKKNLSSASSQELVPLTLESVYGTILTHSSLFAQSGGHRNLQFEFRVFLNFRVTLWFLNKSSTVRDLRVVHEDFLDTRSWSRLWGSPLQHVSLWVSKCPSQKSAPSWLGGGQ